VIPILTPDEMAAADAASPVPVEVLIGRAGAAVAHEALDLLGGAYGRRVVVLAGTGNNGADGRAAAVRLRQRGVRVQVVDAVDAPARLPDADLVIDAAYGTGFRGEHTAPEVGDAPVLAVDIPSGIDGSTGEERGRALPAARTVTFAALKPGLVLEPGRSVSGPVVVADIGLDIGIPNAGAVVAEDVRAWLVPRASTSHKWTASVLVVAGSTGMTGAAHLAAAAAQRAGAGMVRLGSPGVADDPRRPIEAVGLALPGAGWTEVVLEAAPRFRALVIGPGLGTGAPTDTAIRDTVARAALPTVVDGDALTALGRDVAAVVAGRSEPTVLTPHDGELERLTGSRPGPDRLATARGLAEHTGAVILSKGPSTIVAAPDGRVAVVTAGDERLATAGTGDVLSGIIGALLARGLPPFDAAAAGAWLHARAGGLGPGLGLIASDLIARIPAALEEVSG
jgi:ADP-dependent NAD(P)H-hydrate dehydratase / NAD(P)H-hydrate epimerase